MTARDPLTVPRPSLEKVVAALVAEFRSGAALSRQFKLPAADAQCLEEWADQLDAALRSVVPVPPQEHVFIAGWSAGFQEALSPDIHPEEDRCATAYAEWLKDSLLPTTPSLGGVPAPAEAPKPLSVQEFRRELLDKFSVLEHPSVIPLQRSAARQQCLDFLSDRYREALEASSSLPAGATPEPSGEPGQTWRPKPRGCGLSVQGRPDPA